MKKILPAILGVAVATTLASCTSKETTQEVSKTTTPEVAPAATAPQQAVTETATNTTTGATATTETTTTATATGGTEATATTSGATQSVTEVMGSGATTGPDAPVMTASGTLLPTQAIVEENKKGDTGSGNIEAEMKAKAEPTTSTTPVSMIVNHERVVKYKTPGGLHSVTFNVAVLDGKVSGVRVMPSEDNEISKKFQTNFGAEVSQKVVGKDFKGLKIDTIAGASLTTKAFNDFVAEL